MLKRSSQKAVSLYNRRTPIGSNCQLQQDYDGDRPRSPVSSLGRSSRWSGSAHGPLGPLVSASAPRAVWVPGKDGGKGVRLVDFSLPTWAGVRKSCGCLSFTELTWGKDGMGSRGSGVSGLAMSMGMNSGLAAAFGSGMQVSLRFYSTADVIGCHGSFS